MSGLANIILYSIGVKFGVKSQISFEFSETLIRVTHRTETSLDTNKSCKVTSALFVIHFLALKYFGSKIFASANPFCKPQFVSHILASFPS